VAGVVYGLRPWPRALRYRLPALLAGFGLAVAMMAVPVLAALPGLLALSVVMLLAGCLITPQVTAHSLGVELAAPSGTATEAFGWVITAATLGLAAGQALGGALVDARGPGAAFLAGGCAGLLLAGVMWLARGCLTEAATSTDAPTGADAATETATATATATRAQSTRR
jgi:predicted MFS family arabinose efflux permease